MMPDLVLLILWDRWFRKKVNMFQRLPPPGDLSAHFDSFENTRASFIAHPW